MPCLTEGKHIKISTPVYKKISTKYEDSAHNYCTIVGGSDLAFFAIFEKGHISADQVYFTSKISKSGRASL